MERRTLGKTGLDVSVVGLAASHIGPDNQEQASFDRLVRSAVDAGINIFDAGSGSERRREMLGPAVAGVRNQVHLLASCNPQLQVNAEAVTHSAVIRGIDHTLQRLRTNHLGVLQLCGCGADIPASSEVVRAMGDVRRAGKARYIGCISDSQDALRAVASGLFDVLQTSINLADQEAITMTVPAASERRMRVIAKRPLAEGMWAYEQPPGRPATDEYWRRLQQIDYLFPMPLYTSGQLVRLGEL